MRSIYLFGLSTALVACSEQGFGDQEKVKWKNNPQPDVVEVVVDEFTQTHPTQADVLFVISNWWSMEQAYAELVDSFDDLLQVFIGSGVNYHIGVISTDTDHAWEHGKLHEARGVKWVGVDTPDPIGTFAEMATMDASGCVGPRRPRDATLLALEFENNGHNQGFRRPPASMHTVFVSDDRDTSVMLDFDEWVGWYNTFTETPEIDTLSTIVDFNKDGLNLTATVQIGGTSHPIQNKPWANVLADIGLRAQGLRREYFLSRQPDPETIEIAVIEGEVELGFGLEDFEYDQTRNSVSFVDYEPPELSTIEISYEAL